MTIEQPVCFNCKHRINLMTDPPICEAFKEGIPNEIFWEQNHHTKPLKEQDNDIVFEEGNNEQLDI